MSTFWPCPDKNEKSHENAVTGAAAVSMQDEASRLAVGEAIERIAPKTSKGGSKRKTGSDEEGSASEDKKKRKTKAKKEKKESKAV